MNFRSLDEFWAFYVNQHSKPSTRRWHFVGTLISIFFLMCSILFSWWFLIFVPLSGYGCAWYSHFFIEGNVPATFGHPIWSLLCDFKMFGLMLTGKMDKEIKRLGKRPVLQSVEAAVGIIARSSMGKLVFDSYLGLLFYAYACAWVLQKRNA